MLNKRSILLSALFFIIFTSSMVYIYWNDDPNVDVGIFDNSTKIRIAAFNIQIFGRTKRTKIEVMKVLVDIAREFDVLLVQEIRDSSEETIPYYIDQINDWNGSTYAYVRSMRVGRTQSKEAYAYLYNTDTVTFIEGSDYVFNDTGDVFEREPFIASFNSSGFDFTLVGIHTKPDDAFYEIGNLSIVIETILYGNPVERDIIVMGDFNADGSYYDEYDDSNALMSEEYFWIIGNEWDTMTKTDWTYDRIVLLESTYNYEYVENSGQVYYFDQIYSLNTSLTTSVSDHYPIWAEFKTSLSDDD